MYIVTNRQIHEDKKGLDKFGKKPNQKGPNELRLVSVERSARGFKVEELADTLTDEEVADLASEFGFDVDSEQTYYQSLRVACDVFRQATDENKCILFYVHGYNNDIKDVVDTCFDLESTYPDVIVVPFSWPANGGGALTGTLAYKSDKADARQSADALGRFVRAIAHYHSLLTAATMRRIEEESRKRAGDNYQELFQRISAQAEAECRSRLTLLCHSMGNYVAKHSLRPSDADLAGLVFDNVCLVAADTNSRNHREWVDRIQTRGDVFIVINEDDFALKWSRRKPGKEQQTRLGHSLSELDSSRAIYLDVSRAEWVENKHTYFIREATEKNKRLQATFRDLFTGNKAHRRLEFRPDVGAYIVN